MKRHFTKGACIALSGLMTVLIGCASQQQAPSPQAAMQPAATTPKVAKAMGPIQQGQKLAIEFCQACHYFEGTDQAGTAGPPLVAMKARFPERQRLQNIISDPQAATKPDSMMPPFRRNGLLDEQQVGLIVDYLYTL